MNLLDDLHTLVLDAETAFMLAKDSATLEAARIEFLGTRGRLKQLLGRMGEVPREQKPLVGKQANETTGKVQALFDAAQQRVQASAGSVAAEGSGYAVLRQERLDKLAAYEKQAYRRSDSVRLGAQSIRRPADGKSLTPISTAIRKRFEALDPAQHTDPERAATDEVYVAARVMLRRDQSKKLIFLTVQDQSGTLQLGLWNTLLNEDTLALLRDTLDLWDIVGVSGRLAYTQKGEPTVWATSVRVLSKCIAPPPDKHHGLTDKEVRYRQRYLDLIATPESRATFILRARAVAGLRRFLDEQGFLEMETPTLQTIPGGAAARPFETRLNALDMKMYLRIATEIPLKKLLVGGLEKVYELGRIFRNEGIDARHNPEFTTVELYQAFGDLRDMQALTENSISHLAETLTGSTTVTWRGTPIKLKAPWPRLEYCELLKQHAGVSYDDVPGLERKLREIGVNPEGLSHVDKIDGVFGEFCEPHLQDACFVINQPVEMSPLCRAHPNDARLADRFEAFAAGMEIANAYSELNDPLEQHTRLLAQLRGAWLKFVETLSAETLAPRMKAQNEALRGRILADARWRAEHDPSTREYIHEVRGHLATGTFPAKRVAFYREQLEKLFDPSQAVDDDFLCALEHGMPPAGGLGIGIDRVIMLLAGADSIRDVVLFPLMRPEQI